MTKLVEVTDDGLVFMTENEIHQAVIDKYQEIDPDFNADESTFDSYMAAWYAEQLRIAVEGVVASYNSKDPAKARDTDLNIIGSLTGATRDDGTASVISIEVYGTENTVVLAGSVLSGLETWSWTVDEDITIGGAGVGSGTATCSIVGDASPEVGTVTTIRTVIAGWTGATNTGIVYLGTLEQSNELFRVERQKAVAKPGSNQVDSTIGAIFAVDDVTRVAAFENPTSSAVISEDNPYGLPRNSVSYLVYGGDNTAIANAIFSKKNPGFYLNAAGSPVVVTVASEKYPTNTQNIRFGRPTDVPIPVIVELADPLGSLPTNIETLIQDAIISYVNGELIEASVGFDATGFGIGEDVPVRRLDTPINQVIGQYNGAYINSTTVSGLSSGVVSINYDEISSWDSGNISVSIA